MMTVMKTIVTTVIAVPNNPPAPPGMIHTKTFESKRKRNRRVLRNRNSMEWKEEIIVHFFLKTHKASFGYFNNVQELKATAFLSTNRRRKENP